MGSTRSSGGGSGRREATRLLTERQIRKHGSLPDTHGRKRRGYGLADQRADKQADHGEVWDSQTNDEAGSPRENQSKNRSEPEQTSPTKKEPRCSKCRGRS